MFVSYKIENYGDRFERQTFLGPVTFSAININFPLCVIFEARLAYRDHDSVVVRDVTLLVSDR